MGVCASQEGAALWAETVDIESIFDHIETDEDLETDRFVDHAPTYRLLLKSTTRENQPSLLHSAVEWKRKSLIVDLVHAQCDIEITDKNGYTPLHQAVQLDASSTDNARIELVEKLIELGADINSTTTLPGLEGTWSPLDTAEDRRESFSGANQVIELLLAKGAQNANYAMPFDPLPKTAIEDHANLSPGGSQIAVQADDSALFTIAHCTVEADDNAPLG